MMNQIWQAAAESIRFGWLMGVMTLLFIGCFGFWIWWAYAPSHKKRWEEAARMPFSMEDSRE